MVRKKERKKERRAEVNTYTTLSGDESLKVLTPNARRTIKKRSFHSADVMSKPPGG